MILESKFPQRQTVNTIQYPLNGNDTSAKNSDFIDNSKVNAIVAMTGKE